MSADNRICIMKWEDGLFYVWEGSLSVYYYEPSKNACSYKSEEEALDGASELCKGLVVCEGGIQIITKEEQIRGLAYEIEDLSTRLRLLVTSNKQWDSNYN